MGSQGSQGQRSIYLQLQIVSYFVIHGFNQHYSIHLLKFLLGLYTPYNFPYVTHAFPLTEWMACVVEREERVFYSLTSNTTTHPLTIWTSPVPEEGDGTRHKSFGPRSLW